MLRTIPTPHPQETRKFFVRSQFWKSIGFVVFSSANVSETNVLSILRSKNVIKLVKNLVFWSKCCTFTENPCAKMQKKTQKSEKSIMFYVKNCKTEALLLRILVRKCIFESRNPRGTLFRAGRPIGTTTPLYILSLWEPLSLQLLGNKNQLFFKIFDRKHNKTNGFSTFNLS